MRPLKGMMKPIRLKDKEKIGNLADPSPTGIPNTISKANSKFWQLLTILVFDYFGGPRA